MIEIDGVVIHMIVVNCLNWRVASGVIYAKQISPKLRAKFFSLLLFQLYFMDKKVGRSKCSHINKILWLSSTG